MRKCTSIAKHFFVRFFLYLSIYLSCSAVSSNAFELRIDLLAELDKKFEEYRSIKTSVDELADFLFDEISNEIDNIDNAKKLQDSFVNGNIEPNQLGPAAMILGTEFNNYIQCMNIASQLLDFPRFRMVFIEAFKDFIGESVVIKSVSDIIMVQVTIESINQLSIPLMAHSELGLKLRWNAECARRISVDAGYDVAGAEICRMSDREIRISGNIYKGFSEDFHKYLAENSNIKIVSLGNTGGSIKEAVAVGNFIRDRSIATTLHGNCVSSCLLMFLGGVDRWLDSSAYTLGVHQILIGGRFVDPIHPVSAKLYGIVDEYIEQMGARGNYIVKKMKKHSDVYYLSEREIDRSRAMEGDIEEIFEKYFGISISEAGVMLYSPEFRGLLRLETVDQNPICGQFRGP